MDAMPTLNPGRSHLEILTLITLATILISNQVPFRGPRWTCLLGTTSHPTTLVPGTPPDPDIQVLRGMNLRISHFPSTSTNLCDLRVFGPALANLSRGLPQTLDTYPRYMINWQRQASVLAIDWVEAGNSSHIFFYFLFSPCLVCKWKAK